MTFSTTRGNSHPDVFVVGGGPAALAFAIAAAEGGFRVAVADATRPPVDKACGEGLMPDTAAALESLGVTFSAGEGVPFRGIRFRDAAHGAVVEALFPGRAGLGVRRTVLHEKLAACAGQRGVELLWGARVTRIGHGELDVNGATVRSRWIIGAEGQDSQVRRWAGLEPLWGERARFGCRQHFRVTPWSDFVEVHWGTKCQVTVAPVSADEICLAVTSRSPRLRIKDALVELPELAARLAGAQPSTRERGAACALRRLWAVHRGHCALIGDASGSVDPVTGAGLGLAFKQARPLAGALRANHLARYGRAHARICRIPRLLSRFVLLMDEHPKWRGRILRALASDPALFSSVLKLHVQGRSPSDFSVADAFRLGWRCVAGAS